MKQYSFIHESYSKLASKLVNVKNNVNNIHKVLDFFNNRIRKNRNRLKKIKDCIRSHGINDRYSNKFSHIENQYKKIYNDIENFLSNNNNVKKITIEGSPFLVTRDGNVYSYGGIYGIKRLSVITKTNPKTGYQQKIICIKTPSNPRSKTKTMTRIMQQAFKDNNTETGYISNNIRDRVSQHPGVGANFIVKHLDGNSLNNNPENLQWVHQLHGYTPPVSVGNIESKETLANLISQSTNLTHAGALSRIRKATKLGQKLDLFGAKTHPRNKPVEGFPSIKDYIKDLSEKTGLPYKTLHTRYVDYGIRGEDLIRPLKTRRS